MKNVTPLALVSPDTGLTKEQQIQAAELSAKFPQLEIAYKKVKQQEENLRGKWFHFCDLLREPSKSAKLNGREMTLLLLSFGERKQRATEIIKVVSVDDDVWAKYKANVIGFKAVLQLARNPNAQTSDTETDTEAGTDEGKKPKDSPVIKTIPPTYASIICNALADDPKQFEPTGKGYYELVYVTPYGDHGRKFTVTIEVDDIAKK